MSKSALRKEFEEWADGPSTNWIQAADFAWRALDQLDEMATTITNILNDVRQGADPMSYLAGQRMVADAERLLMKYRYGKQKPPEEGAI